MVVSKIIRGKKHISIRLTSYVSLQAFYFLRNNGSLYGSPGGVESERTNCPLDRNEECLRFSLRSRASLVMRDSLAFGFFRASGDDIVALRFIPHGIPYEHCSIEAVQFEERQKCCRFRQSESASNFDSFVALRFAWQHCRRCS
jgi:hypothetical protein